MSERLAAYINPELLVWARESARMGLTTAAKKLRVTTQKLSAWESDRAHPTVRQLRKCAETYRRPLAAFFLSKTPPIPKRTHDFRCILDDRHETEAHSIEFEVRRVTLSREHALHLANSLGEELPRLSISTRTNANVDMLGSQVRDELGVSLQTQFKRKDSYEALRMWINALEAKGVLVFQCSRIDTEIMRGISISEETLPIILLNGGDTPNGRIFSLMHEFAHLLIHRGGICDTIEYRGYHSSEQQIERFCNQFAAAFLVPKTAIEIEPEMQNQEWDENSLDNMLESLGAKYHVSREVILGRFYNLGMISQVTYDNKLMDFKEQYARTRSRKKKHGGDYFRTTVRNNGLAYTRIVLKAYGQDVIDAGDVSDLLNIQIKHLPRVQDMLMRMA